VTALEAFVWVCLGGIVIVAIWATFDVIERRRRR